MQGEFERADSVFGKAGEMGNSSDVLVLQRAIVHLIRLRDEEAQVLLESLVEPGGDKEGDRFRQRARIFLGYFYLTQEEPLSIKKLKTVAAMLPQSPEREGQLIFYSVLLAILQRMDETVLAELERARRLIDDHESIALVYARVASGYGRYREAIEALQAVSGVAKMWPPLNMVLASALFNDGQNFEALRVLNQLHERGFASKETIQIFRDAANREGLAQVGRASQELLEENFPRDPDVRMFSGLDAIERGALGKAETVFRDLSTDYPEEAQYQWNRLRMMLMDRNYEEALSAAQEGSVSPLLLAPLIAIAHARLQQWDAAELDFKTSLLENPTVFAHVEYGNFLLSRDRVEEAEKQYAEALELSPDTVEARNGLARVAFAGNDWDEFRIHQEVMLTFPSQLGTEDYFLLAMGEFQMGNTEEAIQFCGRGLVSAPNSVPIRSLRARCNSVLGRNEAAVKDFRFVRSQDPSNEFARDGLIKALIRLGDDEGAMEIVDSVLEVEPGYLAYVLLKFDILGRNGRLDEASNLIDRVESELPEFRYAPFKSWIHQLRGDLVTARKLIEPHLDNEDVALQSAILHLELVSEEALIESLEPLEFNPILWTNLAVVAAKKNRHRVAAYGYRRVLEGAPENPELLNNWAWSALQNPGSDLEAILEATKRAYETLQGNLEVIDTHSVALLRGDRFAECRRILTDNMALTLKTPELLYNLAETYRNLGEPEKALIAYRQCEFLLRDRQKWEFRVGKEKLLAQIEQLQGKKN